MRSRLVLCSLAGAVVLGGCLDRKTGNPDANPSGDSLPANPQGLDGPGPGGDAPPAGSDGDVSLAVPGLDGAALPGTGGVASSGLGGTNGPGGALGSSGGATGSGGAVGLGGITTTSGPTAKGGTMAPGGAVGTGGMTGRGGVVGTGGAIGTGGITGTGGTTCQPKSRDCTSSLDNDCNGKPDNQETTYCACPFGESRACLEHPGYDGKGVCKAGKQSCTASSDKKTSSWGDCTGAVAPGTEVCDAAGLDENCDGQSNEGCECVNGASIPCDCGPATTCTNGKKGTCAVSKVTLYLDSDGDAYGDPARPASVCPGTSGYVSNADDCNDSDPTFKPGVSVCAADSVTRRWCVSGAGGTTKTEPCDQGCFNGICRNDGTVGLPGIVTCTATHSPRCLAADGCDPRDGTCGATDENYTFNCDGPNDCPAGQKCWYFAYSGITITKCASSAPGSYKEVCDPLAGTCDCGQWTSSVVNVCG